MISELLQSDFHRCNNLINKEGQAEVKAIIEGNNAGRIFVDNRLSPTSGLIWLGNHDGFFFIGDASNQKFNEEINDFIERTIFPEARKLKLESFEVMGNHSQWNEIIEQVFANRELGSWKQNVFKLYKEDYLKEKEPSLEKGYEVKQITKELCDSDDFNNIEFVHKKVLEFWADIDTFLRKGIGYCVVYEYDQTIVSVCFTGFIAEDVHVVDIETHKHHQGKKLGQRVAHSYVKECIERKVTPYWDCMEENHPSRAIAERIGFTREFTYKGYEFGI
ncbi:GNAT family N-acetyltransferase [Pontibacillus yanchengensis]|uniref:Acetyltransferase n=1 Tax=Pontibacillus yanchengensis Y32 TaxID=1385514 RepID=A0A0A2T8H8_9BACI|nr:GNAT family N-acetyltransferase [Pontibacillus yanchengensis]KGP72127.1 acetyltransferase [Pontibacillus yanchengensis Y32]